MIGISAETLWSHLFEADEGYLVGFSGRQSASGRANELRDVRQSYFRYPSEAERAGDLLRQDSEAGRDAYFGVHLFGKSGTRRRTDALPTVRALWLDEDEGRYPDDAPEPGVIVHSSEHRRHLYWPLSEPVTTEVAVSLNRRIATLAGGDIGKAALSSVLRVPETNNYKRLPRVDSVTAHATGAVWRPEELDALIPVLPKEERSAGRRPYRGEPGKRLDLREFLSSCGVIVLGTVSDASAAEVFRVVCPWVHEHTGGDRSGTRCGQYPDGATFFHCEHSHCSRRSWPEFRAEVAPKSTFKSGKVYSRQRGVIRVG